MTHWADKNVCDAKTMKARNKPFGDFIDKYVNSKFAKFAGASLTGSGDIERFLRPFFKKRTDQQTKKSVVPKR